jgi:dephospho-CoA kinase
MIRAGLTGGYATGKSFVAAEFARLGCEVIHADVLGHQTLLPDGEAYAPVVARFGPGILAEGGLIDRKKLASVVFPSPELLAELNAMVHPAVFRKEKELSDAFAQRSPNGILIYEAAILIETGRYKLYDRLILTTADMEVQIARAMDRDGITREHALGRIGRQLPQTEKRKYADFVIDSSGTKQSTIRQVEGVYGALKELAEGGPRT